jgi:hypothetical protein
MSIADNDIHVFAAGEGDTVRLGATDKTTLEAAQ